MPRRQRYHLRNSDKDEFETPALREAERQPPRDEVVSGGSDSEDDLQSESGLGESPEEDLMEDVGKLSDGDEEKDDSSDDEAPEELGLKATREAERSRMQFLLNDIHKSQEELKNKRRKRDQLFKLQKQEKMAALKKRKLPEEFLEHLATDKKEISEEKKQKSEHNPKSGKGDQPPKAKEDHSAEAGPEEATGDIGFDLSDDDQGTAIGARDFIPLSGAQDKGTEVKVVHLGKGQQKTGLLSDRVAEFKKNMLFGKRHRRITNQQARMTIAKRRARR